jgi:hypothetical protein
MRAGVVIMTDGNDDRIARMRRALDLARAALERDAGERESWLAAQCAGDAGLHAESIALLRVDSAPTHAIERAGNACAPADDEPPQPQIGRFRLLERIGSGGMGTVWRAEPVAGVARQNVALKLIKRGMDSEDIVARFVRERGILARLDHPHIARLLDGGLADDGRPWFAMESSTASRCSRIAMRGGSTSTRASRCSSTSATRCRTRIATSSCIATSSPRTCSSHGTARSSCSTSASPSCSIPAPTKRRAPPRR